MFLGCRVATVARVTGRSAGALVRAVEALGSARLDATSLRLALVDELRRVVPFDAYVWRFVGGAPLRHRPKTMRDIPTTTAESDALSKDLKKRGMSFVGSTIIYAYMQAAGLIDDHITGCFKAAR